MDDKKNKIHSDGNQNNKNIGNKAGGPASKPGTQGTAYSSGPQVKPTRKQAKLAKKMAKKAKKAAQPKGRPAKGALFSFRSSFLFCLFTHASHPASFE